MQEYRRQEVNYQFFMHTRVGTIAILYFIIPYGIQRQLLQSHQALMSDDKLGILFYF